MRIKKGKKQWDYQRKRDRQERREQSGIERKNDNLKSIIYTKSAQQWNKKKALLRRLLPHLHSPLSHPFVFSLSAVWQFLFLAWSTWRSQDKCRECLHDPELSAASALGLHCCLLAGISRAACTSQRGWQFSADSQRLYSVKLVYRWIKLILISEEGSEWHGVALHVQHPPTMPECH